MEFVRSWHRLDSDVEAKRDGSELIFVSILVSIKACVANAFGNEDMNLSTPPTMSERQ